MFENLHSDQPPSLILTSTHTCNSPIICYFRIFFPPLPCQRKQRHDLWKIHQLEIYLPTLCRYGPLFSWWKWPVVDSWPSVLPCLLHHHEPPAFWVSGSDVLIHEYPPKIKGLQLSFWTDSEITYIFLQNQSGGSTCLLWHLSYLKLKYSLVVIC